MKYCCCCCLYRKAAQASCTTTILQLFNPLQFTENLPREYLVRALCFHTRAFRPFLHMALSFEPEASSLLHSLVMGFSLRGLLPLIPAFVLPIRACHARRLNSTGSSLLLDLVNRRLRISYLAWKLSTDGFCYGFAFGYLLPSESHLLQSSAFAFRLLL